MQPPHRDHAACGRSFHFRGSASTWVWFVLFLTLPFVLVSCTGIAAKNTSAGGPASSSAASGAQLVVSPSNLSFSAVRGGVNPASQTVSISNSGTGTLAWTATGDQPWITLSSPSGTAPQSVLIGSTAASLATGTYAGNVTISAPEATPSVQTIRLTLAVTSTQTPGPTGTPALAVSPTAVTFTGTAGASNPSPQNVNISNTGGGSLSWTAVANQPWVILSAASGVGPLALSIDANTAGLSAGNYSATIMISAPGANPATQVVGVSLALAAAAPAPIPAPPPTGTGVQHYVAPSGSSSGDGSINNPWDLQTALNQPAAVQPGDTIWMRNGTYGNGVTQFASALTGTSSQPIIVRQYPGERATIAGELTVNGSYAWYWGFEVANTTAPTRSSGTSGSFAGPSTYTFGIVIFGSNTKFINLIVHDTQEGFSAWTPSQNSEIYGSLSYNNGWQGTDRGHGHGIYTQNQNGFKTISDNIIFQGFGEGIQAYGSSSAFVQNYIFDGNTIFNSGSLAAGDNDENIILEGGSGGPQNITLTNNYTYHTLNGGTGASFLSGSNLTVTGNYWVGGNTTLYASGWSGGTFTNNTVYSLTGYGLITDTLQPTTWDNNSYYDGAGLFGEWNSQGISFASWQSATGLDKNSSYATAPTGASVFVRPNKYESGRANITIYNWNLTNTVAVDVSQVLTVGSSYELRNAQDFFGTPVLAGTYSGGTLTIPMTGLSVAQPTGTVPRAAAPTGPQFGAFVLITQ